MTYEFDMDAFVSTERADGFDPDDDITEFYYDNINSSGKVSITMSDDGIREIERSSSSDPQDSDPAELEAWGGLEQFTVDNNIKVAINATIKRLHNNTTLYNEIISAFSDATENMVMELMYEVTVDYPADYGRDYY